MDENTACAFTFCVGALMATLIFVLIGIGRKP